MTSILLASITVLAAQIPNAEATCNGLIDFDTFPNGTVPADLTKITTQYETCGVSLFTTNDPGGPIIRSFPLGSPPNILAPTGLQFGFTGNIGMEFSSPISGDVSVLGVDVRHGGLRLQAFDSTNVLIDTYNISPSSVSHNEIMTVSGTDIARLAISQIVPQTGGFVDGYAIDDLSFTAPTTVPSQPTGLTAIATGLSTIQLAWTTPADDGGSPITGYKIERESPIGGGFITIVADTGTTATTFQDPGLSSATEYNYRVSAINAIGTGASSNEAAAITFTPVEALEDTSVDLETIINNNPGTPLADKLEDANAKVETAIVELNKTPPDNQAALGNIEGAVGDIQAAVDAGLLDDLTGNVLMDQLVGIARQLAVDAIDTAIATPGSDPVEIADAQQFLADGDALRAADQFKDAVAKYKDALAKAESALP